MARDISKQIQLGLVVGFGAFLIANAKPLPLPDVEPALRAGASNLPIVDWQTTEVDITCFQPETAVTADPQVTAEPKVEDTPQVEDVQVEDTPQVEAESEPELDTSIETEDDSVFQQPGYPPVYDKTFFALAIQAEGYTMGHEGMRYIASAMINLARDRGCSVDAVLTSGAYTVVNDGTVWRKQLYPECMQVVEEELTEQIDTEIKYFRTNHYHGFGTPVFHYGNVYFSK